MKVKINVVILVVKLINLEIDPDLNQELFGDHDQRRSNKVSRNATPSVSSNKHFCLIACFNT